MIFLEDDDVAAVVDGRLSIHRIKRTAGDHPGRAVQTLQMELQQIMKGESCWVAPGRGTAAVSRWEGRESPGAIPAPVMTGPAQSSLQRRQGQRSHSLLQCCVTLMGKNVPAGNGTFPPVVGTLLRRTVGLRILPPAWSRLVFPRLIPHKLASLDLPFTDTFQKPESSSHHELMFWQKKKYQFNNL